MQGPQYSTTERLVLSGIPSPNIMRFGTSAFNPNVRDQDFMVFDEANDPSAIMQKMQTMNMRHKGLKSTDFLGGNSVSTIELFSGEGNVDVCVVQDQSLWDKWILNSTNNTDGSRMVSKEIQAESYYHMVKSTTTSPLEVIKALSGLVVMALLFVEHIQYYKMCLGMIKALNETRNEVTKFRVALEMNMQCMARIASNQITLTNTVSANQNILQDCRLQLENVTTENTSLRTEIKHLRTTMDGLRAQVDRVETLEKQTRSKVEQLVEKNNDLQKQLASAINDVEKSNKRATDLERDSQLLKQQLKSDSNKDQYIKNQQEELDLLKSQTTNSGEENAWLRSLIDKKTQQLAEKNEEVKTMTSTYMAMKEMNRQYEQCIKDQRPSAVMNTVIRQFVSDLSPCIDFTEELSLVNGVLNLPMSMGSYFQLAFLHQSTDNLIVYACTRAAFGFAFNMDRTDPTCQMVMVVDLDHIMHICISDEIHVVPGVFEKEMDPLKEFAQVAPAHPLDCNTLISTITPLKGIDKVLSIIFQRLCSLDSLSMQLSNHLLRDVF